MRKKVEFRMSPESYEVLEKKVRMSGLTRQDYLMKAVEGQKIREFPPAELYCLIREAERIASALEQLVIYADSNRFINFSELQKTLERLGKLENRLWEELVPEENPWR